MFAISRKNVLKAINSTKTLVLTTLNSTYLMAGRILDDLILAKVLPILFLVNAIDDRAVQQDLPAKLRGYIEVFSGGQG